MLILQRKPGESLFIGEEIEVSVVSVEAGGRVRLAIEAPRSMTILRNELRRAMAANQEAAREEASPFELLGLIPQVKSIEESGTQQTDI